MIGFLFLESIKIRNIFFRYNANTAVKEFTVKNATRVLLEFNLVN